MVSSVFVEFVGDDDVGGTRTTEVGEEGKTISGREVALWVGEEGMFRMEIKIWHTRSVSLSRVLKLI